MDIFVINMAKATERLAFQQEQMARLGLSFETIIATTPDTAQQDLLQKMKKLWIWERPPAEYEIATLLSYAKAWQKILENNRPAFILEDDAVLDNNTPLILEKLANNKTNVGIVNLEKCSNIQWISKKKLALTNKINLYKCYYFRCSSAAYVLYPSGAKILLDAKEKRLYPADVLIWTPHIKMERATIEPATIYQHPQWRNNTRFPNKIKMFEDFSAWFKYKKYVAMKYWFKIRYYFHSVRRPLI